MFAWQFFIPLVLFVVAYWKILGVVRRQAKVAVGRQRIAATSNEPVAKTAMTAVEQANVGPSTSNDERDMKAVTAESKGHREVGSHQKSMNSEMSRAQTNVVRTMVYITVCFSLCWMPLYFYYILFTLKVRHVNVFDCSLRQVQDISFSNCSALCHCHDFLKNSDTCIHCLCSLSNHQSL